MRTIFGPDWDALELADVQAFFDAADDESEEWEAKGTEIDRYAVRRTVCGFANSQKGGYLIIGADQRDGEWRLEGYSFPDEPRVWIDQVVRDGVEPVPTFDVRSWKVNGSDRHVVVVRVDPLATPPCLVSGTVYERVQGRTIPVKGQERLRELLGRGDHALEAQAKARRLRPRMLELGRQHRMYRPDRVQVVLTAAASRYEPDISARLFSPEFRDALEELPKTTLLSGVPQNFTHAERQTRQDVHLLTTWAPEMGFSTGWIALGSWDGAVGVYLVIDQDTATNDAIVGYAVEPAWRAAVQLLKVLGAYGPTYVALSVSGWHHQQNVETFGADTEPGTKLDRGPIEATAGSLDLDSVRRELDRSLGIDTLE